MASDSSLMASDCVPPQVNITSARLFYMGALIIGYFVIFNLFIAILLDSFGSDEEGEGEGEEGEGEAEKGGAQDGARDPTAEESATSPKDLSQHLSQHRTGSGEPPSSSRQLQRFCRAWAENDYWEGFIILAIFASSVALVLDTPRLDGNSDLPATSLHACAQHSAIGSPQVLDTPRLDENSDLKHVLEHSNYWFTALFTLELIIKCLAFDLLVQPDGYLPATS